MRTLMVGAAVAAYLGTAGMAAADGMYEGSMKDAPVEPIAPVHIWAGLYVGGSLGFGVGDTSGELEMGDRKKGCGGYECGHSSDIYIMEQTKRPRGRDGGLEGLLSSDFDIDGAIYGAHIGYNWQDGAKVFGIEAGINGTGIDGSALCGPFAIATCERELNYYATLVGRLGYAVNALHFYAFGGLAYGEVDTAVSFLGVEPLFNGSTDHFGYTGGVGIEMAITPRFIVGVEYAHVDLGEEDFNVDFGGVGVMSRCEKDRCGPSIRDEVDLDFDVIKIRASMKLGEYHEPLEPLK